MKIRNVEYPITNTADTTLIPMFVCLQVHNVTELTDSSAIAEVILQQLADPSNHRKLAYSLKSAIPSLPDSLVRYKTYLLSDGREEVDFSFGLSAEELTGAIAAIMEARDKAQPVPVDPNELRRAELMRELSLLEQAS